MHARFDPQNAALPCQPCQTVTIFLFQPGLFDHVHQDLKHN